MLSCPYNRQNRHTIDRVSSAHPPDLTYRVSVGPTPVIRTSTGSLPVRAK
jgi:hypothetical protein